VRRLTVHDGETKEILGCGAQSIPKRIAPGFGDRFFSQQRRVK
jgi:hypothetical protein